MAQNHLRTISASVLYALVMCCAAAALPRTVSSLSPVVYSDSERPLPHPITPPPAFNEAVEAGTRTTTGHPGPNYWTNTASYNIRARIEPESSTLHGEQEVTYYNNSPDTLSIVAVHLHQNLHMEGAVRNRPVEVTGGVQLDLVSVNGRTLEEHHSLASVGYVVDGTLMYVRLPDVLRPDESLDLAFEWSFRVPEAGAPRMGQDGDVFYLGYWYPQIAVYDDIRGWNDDPYMGNGEFYMGYADYAVDITVPQGWLVAATGTHDNAEETLTDTVRKNLARASETRDIIRIVDPDGRGAGNATHEDESGWLTWHYRAANVRDFAFGTSENYIWDATSAYVGDVGGDAETSLIHALYRPGTAAWEEAAQFGQFSVEYMSEEVIPYPYPHMTIVEGVIGGGMEYPMITLIGGNRNDYTLFSVILHEIAHMWYPMLVGSDEKSFTWMDEGPASFFTNEGLSAYFEQDAWDPRLQNYYFLAGTGEEVEAMRHADEYPVRGPARVVASYSKPAVTLHALRGIVGHNRFIEALREYTVRWTNKHPQPYDLFNTFEDVLREDLDWFWRSMLYETWTLNHSIKDVVADSDIVVVTVEDTGEVPMPVFVRITYENGNMEEQTIPVHMWLGGSRTAQAVFPGGIPVLVELDPDRYLPDIDRSLNTWGD